MCLARHNNHPTSLASSWDISFLRSLVQQDPKGSDKVAHLFILNVYVSPNRKYVNLSIIYYILDFSFLMSQDDAYFHIHQNDPPMFSQVMIYRTLSLLLNALQWPESDEYLQTVSTSSWLDHDLLIEYLMASKLPDFVLCSNNWHLWLQISRFPRDTFISVSCLLSTISRKKTLYSISTLQNNHWPWGLEWVRTHRLPMSVRPGGQLRCGRCGRCGR